MNLRGATLGYILWYFAGRLAEQGATSAECEFMGRLIDVTEQTNFPLHARLKDLIKDEEE